MSADVLNVDGARTHTGEGARPAGVIQDRYLLISHIPIYRRSDGQYGTGRLWHKDLVGHFRVLKHLVVAAPIIADWPEDVVPFTPAQTDGGSVEFVSLPFGKSVAQVLRALPEIVSTLWRETGASKIVHIGVTGGPIPLGWLAGPIAKLRHRFLVVMIESSPWRVDGSAPLPRRLRGLATEGFAHLLCNLASASFFTQSEYMKRYLRNPEKGFINTASWIDDHNVLATDQARAVWAGKPATLRVAFAGRLVAEKGVPVLLEALRALEERGVPLECDIFGTGELAAACAAAADTMNGSVKVRARGSLPYDESFFAALRGYHAVVIPSLGEEQPRIVYDAFSQALPCLASDTAGLRQCIEEQVTGRLTPPGDSARLAELLAWAATHPRELERMGMAALEVARKFTHENMHRERCEILIRRLSAHGAQAASS